MSGTVNYSFRERKFVREEEEVREPRTDTRTGDRFCVCFGGERWQAPTWRSRSKFEGMILTLENAADDMLCHTLVAKNPDATWPYTIAIQSTSSCEESWLSRNHKGTNCRSAICLHCSVPFCLKLDAANHSLTALGLQGTLLAQFSSVGLQLVEMYLLLHSRSLLLSISFDNMCCLLRIHSESIFWNPNFSLSHVSNVSYKCSSTWHHPCRPCQSIDHSFFPWFRLPLHTPPLMLTLAATLWLGACLQRCTFYHETIDFNAFLHLFHHVKCQLWTFHMFCFLSSHAMLIVRVTGLAEWCREC